MSKMRFKYTYEPRFGSDNHHWTAIGALGAMHFHVSGPFEHCKYDNEGYSGGLETHYRSPPDHMKDDAPSHDDCWVLKCPCWHDGTSLYASERLIPNWLHDKNDHAAVFRMLEGEYTQRFALRCEETEA